MSNREIKFRVWDKDMKRWVKNPVIDTALSYSNFYEVQQFTGLKDKNKKDIYEGDIIKFRDENNTENFGKIEWGNYGDGCTEEYVKNVECWMAAPHHLPLSTIENYGVRYGRGTETNGESPEIVGNIFQDSELIK